VVLKLKQWRRLDAAAFGARRGFHQAHAANRAKAGNCAAEIGELLDELPAEGSH
jgi:hypothetical protein